MGNICIRIRENPYKKINLIKFSLLQESDNVCKDISLQNLIQLCMQLKFCFQELT